MMDEGEVKSPLVTGTTCESCGKSFSSPKALGGHMRIHRSKMNRSSAESGGPNADEPICSVCGKDFPSMKSLFGHMRCHPERDYRGIKAPADKNKNKKKKTTATGSSSSSSSLDEIGNGVDLMKASLLCWPVTVTGKRGRGPNLSSNTTSSEEDEKKLLGAVEALLSLAHSHPEVTNSNSLTNQSNNKQQLAVSDHDYLEEKLNLGCPEKQKRKLMELDDSNNHSLNKKKIKIHVINIGNSMESANDHDQKYFKCSDCNRSFSTHQALGGHKSSHNKHMIKIQNQSNSSASEIMMVTGDKANERSDLTGKMQVESCSTSSNPHQCKRCNKIFPSGQALGGHMRRHYIGNLSDSSSQAHSPGETSQTGRILHAFDLNQVPTIDQDELAVTGFACASSSYIINN